MNSSYKPPSLAEARTVSVETVKFDVKPAVDPEVTPLMTCSRIDGRYGPRHRYLGDDGETYLLSGIERENSVLLHHPLERRFTSPAEARSFWVWLRYNVSALFVMIVFYGRLMIERPESSMAKKALLSRCHPLWYPDHEMATQIRRCTTGTGALVPIYDREAIFRDIIAKSDDERAFLLEYAQPEAIDLTNRLMRTANWMYNYLLDRYDDGQRLFRLVSIACGSSRAMLDVAHLLVENFTRQEREIPLFEFHFVDTNGEALRSAYDTAKYRGFTCTTYEMNARAFMKIAGEQGWTFDVVEMVGLADYLPNKKRIQYYRGCYKLVTVGGIFIVAHINVTWWGFSVKWRTGWPGLRRRFAWQLKHHLRKAGFRHFDGETMPECGAHTVVVAYKPY